MPVINILSPHVADLIAAGEVVERPASVIKELVENSIDAGAKNISVEIRGGGMSLIRVTDDGAGMSPEDAGVAFLRHATSKLRDERGLESIATLGFRGEALAAISSVSHIELLTRTRGASSGVRVTLDAGDIASMGPAGCPEGTTMSVKGLFYNTPARLKFMKSDRAEGSACAAMALRCALGHPEVSLRMLRDGEELFFSPGDGTIKSAVYSLLGRENAMNMLECAGENEGVRVSGFVTAPRAGRGNRAMQFFFINGRAFKNASIQAALEQAYKNTLLTGRFPGCALYIELSFGKVDVNVHPTKSEVKFTEEKKVFDAVYFAVRSALADETATAEIKLSGTTRGVLQPKPDFYKTLRASDYAASGLGGAPRQERTAALHQSLPSYAPSPQVPRPEIPRETAFRPSEALYGAAIPAQREKAAPVSAPVFDAAVSQPAAPVPFQSAVFPAESADAGAVAPEKEACAPISAPLSDLRVIGEAMSTYIIAETGDGLLLIDKHAAHERMIFDRLKAQGAEIMSQSLLIPVTCSPGAETVELIERNLPLLEESGFEIDVYGDESVIIRAVPADTDSGSEDVMLEEICEKLKKGAAGTGARDEILHTIACKAAVKAGMHTDAAEMAVIAEKVVSGQVRYCPHGRPVSAVLTRKELDRLFKRIV